MLAGEADNVNRITSMIENMDKQGISGTQLVHLLHTSSDKILAALQSLQSADTALGKATTLSLSADKQSNSIILSGTPADRARMVAVIEQMDKTATGTIGNTQVFYLNYLKAKDFAPILAKIAHSQYLDDSGGKPGTTGPATPPPSINNTDGTFDQQVSIQAEPNTNAIIVSAPPSVMESLKTVIQQLDVQPKQVLVEAVIAQVDESLAQQLGITWGAAEDGIINSSGSGNSPLQQGFNLGIGIIKSGSLAGIINALSNNNSTNILSTPSIVVLDNQKAVIEVGKTVYTQDTQYPPTSSTTNTPYTTFKPIKVTLKLTVTPQISPNEAVRLILDQKNDTLQNPDDPTTLPIINTSDINTAVSIKSGDILVLGGLISHEMDDSQTKVPVLGDIPLLGHLFRYNNKNLQKRNLMVFLRPVILNQGGTSKQITNERYDYIRRQELTRQAGQHIIDNFKQTPVLPPYTSPAAQLPAPFAGQNK